MAVVFFIVILFCDQAVKVYIRSSFLPGESLSVIPHVFHITYVLNPGAAFGIFANQRAFFIAAGVLLFCLAVYFYPRLRREGRWLRFSVASLLQQWMVPRPSSRWPKLRRREMSLMR